MTSKLYDAVALLVELEQRRTKLEDDTNQLMQEIIFAKDYKAAAPCVTKLSGRAEEFVALEEEIVEQRKMVVRVKTNVRDVVVKMKKENATPEQISQFYVDSFYIPGGGAEQLAEVDKWELDEADVLLDEDHKIGKGAFGIVYRGMVNGKEVACKKLHMQDMDDKILAEFRAEVSLMCKMRHPNLLMLMGVCTKHDSLIMVTELMTKGSVFDLLQDPSRPLNFDRKIGLAKDTALGMNWLHKLTPPILHLDLKSANILVSDVFGGKIADFGLAKVKSSTVDTGSSGSPVYMAPEMLQGGQYDEKADVYSYAMILWELFHEATPYAAEIEKETITDFDSLRDAVCGLRLRPEISRNAPKLYSELICACWVPDRKKRPSFQEILDSRHLDQVSIDAHISEQNEAGRSLWRKHFSGMDAVPWESFCFHFLAAIKVRCSLDDVNLLLLRELIVKDGQSVVTLEQFGRLLEYIGPMVAGPQLFRNLRTLCLTKGFVGDMSTAEAEKTLAGHKEAAPGLYLLRFSQSDPGGFAITALSTGRNIRHWRVSHCCGGSYVLGKAAFGSLEEMIKQNSKDQVISRPLPNCRFEVVVRAVRTDVRNAGYEELFPQV